MDPDEALSLLREAVREARADLDVQGYVNRGEVEVLLERVEALDDWLSRGGTLPQAWARSTR
ncbi:MAG: hypothetical protein ACOYY2_02930 [Actinomycetota bacterium]